MLLAYDIDNFILKNDLLNIDKLNSNYIIEKRLQEQSQAGIINMNGDNRKNKYKKVVKFISILILFIILNQF